MVNSIEQHRRSLLVIHQAHAQHIHTLASFSTRQKRKCWEWLGELKKALGSWQEIKLVDECVPGTSREGPIYQSHLNKFIR